MKWLLIAQLISSSGMYYEEAQIGSYKTKDECLQATPVLPARFAQQKGEIKYLCKTEIEDNKYLVEEKR